MSTHDSTRYTVDQNPPQNDLSTETSPLNLIWQMDPKDPLQCIEYQWIREELLCGRPCRDHVDGHYEIFRPKTIVIYSDAGGNDKDIDIYLDKCHSRKISPVAIHLSDEFLEADLRPYEKCSLIIRHGYWHAALATKENVIQVPLGYTTGLRGNGPIPPSSMREHTCCFMGQLKNDREKMVRRIRELPNVHIRLTQDWAASIQASKAETSRVLRNSIFAPCPKGNWNVDTFRIMEALEFGAIPILKTYADPPIFENYYESFWGKNPIPLLTDWSELPDMIGRWLSNTEELDDLQRACMVWYDDLKQSQRRSISVKIASLGLLEHP